MATPEIFETIAKETLRWPESRRWNTRDKERRYKAVFGASSAVVAELWIRILQRGPIEDGGRPKHLLWALVFLKIYATEELHCSIVGWPSTKTFTKWSLYFVKRISDLKEDLIKLENRFEGLGAICTTNCFMSVDGTNCPVHEPYPFSTKMFSHKFNGPGLKYEVGICLQTGHIVWINGPFEGGMSDSKIFREEGLSTLLYDQEAVEVDRGYGGDSRLKTPQVNWNRKERQMKSNARSQHEIVNGRLKIFNVLTTHFRHMKPNKEGMMAKHQMCFHAVAVITQLKFLLGERIFKAGLDYDVDYF